MTKVIYLLTSVLFVCEAAQLCPTGYFFDGTINVCLMKKDLGQTWAAATKTCFESSQGLVLASEGDYQQKYLTEAYGGIFFGVRGQGR